MKKKKSFYLIICAILLLLALLYWFFIWRVEAYTNDAYVQGNQVYITALHDGFVTGIYTDDSFLVKKGQLIVQLNETDAKIAFKKAQNNLAKAVREVCQAFHQGFVLAALIEKRQAQLLKAQQDFKHRYDVIKEQGVSLEDYEHATDKLQMMQAQLKATINKYKKILSFVQGTSIYGHPSVLVAAQAVRDTWVRLYRCRIYAPVDGLVAQRTIQVGMWVKPNMPLMSVIPLDQIWVNANFKETQMKKMRIGQPVKVTSDLYGWGVVYHGKIVGLPGGAGNAFSLLPPQNLSGNWIKIVQRLPVRVELLADELKKHPLRIGLSMEVTADLSNQSGKLVPINSKGSPNYITHIFEKEEIGDEQLIQKIIAKNLDPSLERFARKKLYLAAKYVPQDSRRAP